ncbi:MAG: hypothetical protein QF645_09530, partial [Planctomycetota bacterium]|nr:hypothetical protein [Planctomycetota bacterium]
MIQSYFEKNRKALEEKNPSLCALVSQSKLSLPPFPTPSGFPTCRIRGENGELVLLHSDQDPVAEVSEAFQLNGQDAVLLLGFGLGYTALHAVRELSSWTWITIVEPDPCILRAAMEYVDLTPLFSMRDAVRKPIGNGTMDDLLLDIEESSSLVTHPLRMAHQRVAKIGIDPLPKDMQEGRRLYHYARNNKVSHGGEFACGSCHFEGTQDDMVWTSPDGLRQTPMLAGRLADTAPYNWFGDSEELQTNMSQTIERLGGEGLSPTELASL